MKTEIKNKAVRAPVNRYKALLKKSDTALAKQYSSKNKYQTGDVLEHASFGRGIATALKQAQIAWAGPRSSVDRAAVFSTA